MEGSKGGAHFEIRVQYASNWSSCSLTVDPIQSAPWFLYHTPLDRLDVEKRKFP